MKVLEKKTEYFGGGNQHCGFITMCVCEYSDNTCSIVYTGNSHLYRNADFKNPPPPTQWENISRIRCQRITKDILLIGLDNEFEIIKYAHEFEEKNAIKNTITSIFKGYFNDPSVRYWGNDSDIENIAEHLLKNLYFNKYKIVKLDKNTE